MNVFENAACHNTNSMFALSQKTILFATKQYLIEKNIT